jgi:hypothetical protein
MYRITSRSAVTLAGMFWIPTPIGSCICSFFSITAAGYRWSSAAMHCGRANSDALAELATWPEPWRFADWREYLNAAVDEQETNAIRQSTHTGRPLGNDDFVHRLELALNRRLTVDKGGRPRKLQAEAGQMLLLE